jgi:hypothetical protein
MIGFNVPRDFLKGPNWPFGYSSTRDVSAIKTGFVTWRRDVAIGRIITTLPGSEAARTEQRAVARCIPWHVPEKV